MIENLLRAESLAARIEAACRAEPELGRLWRAESAVAEAVASVGLEGVRIDATDLLPRVAFNGGCGPERGYAEAMDVERALRALRILKAPGDPLRDPVGCIRRLESLAASRPVQDVLTWAEGEDERPSRGPVVPDEELQALVQSIQLTDPPILGALRLVSAYRAAVPGGEPMVERALFAAAEGALREGAAAAARKGRGGFAAPVIEDEDEPELRGLSQSVGAGWIALPSLALTRGRFGLWDPSTSRGVRQFLEGLVGSLSLDLGRLGVLRDWLRRAREAGQGRTGRSRLSDAARIFASRPVMTARDLADQLGITPRGAINLASELAELGLVGEITHRRSARIWATPELARLLAPRAVATRMQRLQRLASGLPDRSETQIGPEEILMTGAAPARAAGEWDELKARSEARLGQIYKELDEALAGVDALSERFPDPINASPSQL